MGRMNESDSLKLGKTVLTVAHLTMFQTIRNAGMPSLLTHACEPSTPCDNSTMAPVNLPHDFREFLRLPGEHQVEYLIIGGYAVAYHADILKLSHSPSRLLPQVGF